MKRYVSIFMFLILMSQVSAYEHLTNYVNDFANILSPEEEANLNQIISDIEKNTSVEIAIVTLQTTNGEDRTSYANHIGQENGVGKKDTDNGVVILWSVDNEHGGAIATGRGIESILTDAFVTSTGRAGRPLFDQGKYHDAFAFILDRINSELHKQPSDMTTPVAIVQSANGENQSIRLSNLLWPILIMIGSMVFLGAMARVFSGSSYDHDPSDSDYDPKDDLPKRFPKAFLRNYKIIKKDTGKYYKRNKVGIYSLLSAAMLLYLWNRWQDRDDDSDNYSSVGRSSSYISSASSGGGWSGSSGSSGGGGSFGGFGGGSFGGGGGSF